MGEAGHALRCSAFAAVTAVLPPSPQFRRRHRSFAAATAVSPPSPQFCRRHRSFAAVTAVLPPSLQFCRRHCSFSAKSAGARRGASARAVAAAKGSATGSRSRRVGDGGRRVPAQPLALSLPAARPPGRTTRPAGRLPSRPFDSEISNTIGRLTREITQLSPAGRFADLLNYRPYCLLNGRAQSSANAPPFVLFGAARALPPQTPAAARRVWPPHPLRLIPFGSPLSTHPFRLIGSHPLTQSRARSPTRELTRRPARELAAVFGVASLVTTRGCDATHRMGRMRRVSDLSTFTTDGIPDEGGGGGEGVEWRRGAGGGEFVAIGAKSFLLGIPNVFHTSKYQHSAAVLLARAPTPVLRCTMAFLPAVPCDRARGPNGRA
eukprot:gene13484-biopygen4840